MDDLVDFFRSEDLVDGVGMERIKLIIVHLKLACFYTHNQVSEHWISMGSERVTALLINLFIKTEYESYSVMFICLMRFICLKQYKQWLLAEFH